MKKFFIQKHTAHRGFTLVETTIAITIFVALSALLIQALIGYYSSFDTYSADIDTAQSAGRVINEVVSTVRGATSVLTSYTFTSATYTTGASTLVVSEPSINSSGTIISGAYDHVAFYVTGTTLYKLVQPDVSSSRIASLKILSTTVQSFTLTYDSGTMTSVKRVLVDVVNQKVIKGNTTTSHLYEQAYIRNK